MSEDLYTALELEPDGSIAFRNDTYWKAVNSNGMMRESFATAMATTKAGQRKTPGNDRCPEHA
jgi:hypothetical protein